MAKPFDHVKPTGEHEFLIEYFRKKYDDLLGDIENRIGQSRQLSLAMTKLEDSNNWINKAITHGSLQEDHKIVQYSGGVANPSVATTEAVVAPVQAVEENIVNPKAPPPPPPGQAKGKGKR